MSMTMWRGLVAVLENGARWGAPTTLAADGEQTNLEVATDGA